MQNQKILCASRNPTSPAPQSTTGSFTKEQLKKDQNYKPHGTQIVTRNLQNGSQQLPKWRPKPSKIEPKSGQEGFRTTNNSKNNIDPTKRGAASHSAPPFWKKMWPTWLQVGFQNRSKIRCILESIFGMIWKDFGKENGAMFVPNSDPKSMSPLKRKNQLNASPQAPS